MTRFAARAKGVAGLLIVPPMFLVFTAIPWLLVVHAVAWAAVLEESGWWAVVVLLRVLAIALGLITFVGSLSFFTGWIREVVQVILGRQTS